MGTRSLIGRVEEDGSIEGIYCHWDGYPEHNGVILRDHYTNDQKVRKLIKLVDMSFLGPDIGEQHPFDSNDHSVCTFYGRDRGEKNVKARKYPDIKSFVDSQSDAEYIYVWNGIGWACYKPNYKMINLEKVKRNA